MANNTRDEQVIEGIKKVIEAIGAPARKADMLISKDNDCEGSYNVVVSRDFMDEAFDNFDFYKLQILAEDLSVNICPCSGASGAATIYRF